MSFVKGALAVVLFALASAGAATRQAPAARNDQRNRPPTVKLTPASWSLMLAGECSEGERAIPMCRATSPTIRLTAEASDPDGDRLLFTYLTTGGKLSGDGPNTTLDLKGVAPGTYTVTVEVNDGRGGAVSAPEATSSRRAASTPNASSLSTEAAAKPRPSSSG